LQNAGKRARRLLYQISPEDDGAASASPSSLSVPRPTESSTPPSPLTTDSECLEDSEDSRSPSVSYTPSTADEDDDDDDFGDALPSPPLSSSSDDEDEADLASPMDIEEATFSGTPLAPATVDESGSNHDHAAKQMVRR
jgi:hypothetical protein